jgi:hypothetical protein
VLSSSSTTRIFKADDPLFFPAPIALLPSIILTLRKHPERSEAPRLKGGAYRALAGHNQSAPKTFLLSRR